MSYKRTVRCSHCFKTGHNRRSCPELAQNALRGYTYELEKITFYETATDELLKSRGENREWNIQYHMNAASKYRADYIRRTKIDPDTGKKVTAKLAKAERMKNVTCGYCGVKGHTRRTCQNVKNDYEVYIYGTRQLRKEWYEKFKASGMGIGSMIVGKTQGYKGKGNWGIHTVTALVTGVDFNIIEAGRTAFRPISVKTSAELTGVVHGLTVRNLSLDDLNVGPDNHMILSTHPTGSIPSIPAGWLNDFKPIKEVFDTKDPRPYVYQWSGQEWVENARSELGIPKCAYRS